MMPTKMEINEDGLLSMEFGKSDELSLREENIPVDFLKIGIKTNTKTYKHEWGEPIRKSYTSGKIRANKYFAALSPTSPEHTHEYINRLFSPIPLYTTLPI